MELEMCKLCFAMAANQQPVTNSPYAKDFNNFQFIQLQIGYELPYNVCGQCLVQLNQLGSFLKMCKDSFQMYKLMKINQQKAEPSQHDTSVVKDIKQEPMDCESEKITGTKVDVAGNSLETFSNEEAVFETVMLTEPLKTESNSENSSDDCLELEQIKANVKKETTCQTCGANVTTLFDHYTKNPKCWPRSSKCHICNVYFRNKRRLLLHQKARHPVKLPTTVLICHICSETFKNEESLTEHLQEHESNNQYACDQSDIVDSDDDSDIQNSHSEGAEEATAISLDSLPDASRKKYEFTYKKFMEWRQMNNINSFSENVTMTYFEELSKTLKASTLWTQYSILRTTLIVKHNIDLSKYLRVRGFLKRRAEGYTAKKSKILTPEEIHLFLKEAPDHIYLLIKVVLVFGVTGACRNEELRKLTIDDLEDLNSALLVKIPNTKPRVPRTFLITGEFYDIYKRYACLRPSNLTESRFFLNYQNGKCTKQVVGINKFGNMAKQIALFLKLSEPELYTGHCFRRSSVIQRSRPSTSSAVTITETLF